MGYITTPRQAEENAAKRMRDLGYFDARATPVGPDGGIDVVSSRAVAQVKWRGGLVGRPDVQRLYGARGHMDDRELWFFAASGYSPHAVEYADTYMIVLFTYDPTGELQPVNVHAQAVLSRTEPTADPELEPVHAEDPAQQQSEATRAEIAADRAAWERRNQDRLEAMLRENPRVNLRDYFKRPR